MSIPTVKRAEIMSGAASETRVSVHILDYMAYILDPVRFAPVSELPCEAVAVELRNGVHISVTHVACNIPEIEPERGQKRQSVSADCFRDHICNAVVIRQREPRHADAVIVHSTVDGVSAVPRVAERRFVGEKAGDGAAEIFSVMLVMRFVYGIDEKLYRFLTEHINVVRV